MRNLRHNWALGLLFLAGTAQAGQWQSLPAESSLRFAARFEGAEAPGVFHRFEVQLDFGGSAAGDERMMVTVDVTSADLFSTDLNEGAAEADWFDFGGHPSAQFDSRALLEQDDGSYVADGRLRLKGNERAVQVPFTWELTASGARMQGQLILRRGDFDIGTGEWADEESIGQDVLVEFDVRLAQQN